MDGWMDGLMDGWTPDVSLYYKLTLFENTFLKRHFVMQHIGHYLYAKLVSKFSR